MIFSPCLCEQLGDPAHGERDLLRGLDDDAVAGGESDRHRPPARRKDNIDNNHRNKTKQTHVRTKMCVIRAGKQP